jgi:hypothetical protein
MSKAPLHRRVVEAGGVAYVGAGYRPGDKKTLDLVAGLPMRYCPQFVTEFGRWAGS